MDGSDSIIETKYGSISSTINDVKFVETIFAILEQNKSFISVSINAAINGSRNVLTIILSNVKSILIEVILHDVNSAPIGNEFDSFFGISNIILTIAFDTTPSIDPSNIPYV